jgi:hypothetical protein
LASAHILYQRGLDDTLDQEVAMTVLALDHINIMTRDLAGTAAFYADLLDLRSGDGPGGLANQDVIWMYDASGRALIHLKKGFVYQATGCHAELNK